MRKRKEEARIVRLSRDSNGREIWLDTQTSQQLMGIVEREEEQVPHPLIAVAIEALRKAEWRYSLVCSDHMWCYLVGKHSGYTVAFRASSEGPLLACFVEVPVRIPAEKRDVVATYLTRANWGLQLGAFEMDYDDGEVRFRTSAEVSGGKLTPQMVRVLIDTGIPTCDRYLPGLMEVAFGDRSPADTIQAAEA